MLEVLRQEQWGRAKRTSSKDGGGDDIELEGEVDS